MTNNLDLVSRDSTLLLFQLTAGQLNKELLEPLGYCVHRKETRLYIRRDVRHLLLSLLEPRPANISVQDYLATLKAMTFLYRCDNCGELLFRTELQLGEKLTHHCLQSKDRVRHDCLGNLELIGSGPLYKLAARHHRLFPLRELPLPLKEQPLSLESIELPLSA
ncbi:MAG: hypothetical protein AAGL17_09775 [Cyanobacteria bacterium J06576_12]